MADVGHVFVEETTQQNENSTSYVGHVTMVGGDFDDGGVYWLNVSAWVGSNNPNFISGFKLQLGGVDIPFSEMLLEPQDSDNGNLTQYVFRRKITQNTPADDIVFMMKSQFGADTTVADSIGMEALRLDVDLIEGTDYEYAEDTTTTELTETPVAFAAKTFTPDDNNDKWGVFTSQQIGIDDLAISMVCRLRWVEGAVEQSVNPLYIREGEDAGEALCFGMDRGFTLVNSEAHTFEVTLEDDAASAAHNDHLFSSIFILRISGESEAKTFKHGDFSWTEAEHTGTTTFDVMETFDITPDNTGVFFVAGSVVSDNDLDARVSKIRLTLAGVVRPVGVDAWADKIFDNGDEQAFSTFTMQSLASGGARTITLDGQNVTSPSGAIEDRSLIAHSVRLLAEAPLNGANLPPYGQVIFNSADEENRPRYGQRIARGTEE